MRCVIPVFVVLFCWAGAGLAQSDNERAERLFANQVRPLLVEKCGGCHGDGAQKIKGELDMRSLAGLIKGGESGQPAVVPGRPAESLLLGAIRWQDGLEMPPKQNDRLSAEQIEWVQEWIAGGAPWPSETRQKELVSASWPQDGAGGQSVVTSGGQSEDWDRRRYKQSDLWAYRPVQKPQVPWKDAAESGSPVDAFLDRRLAESGISAAPTTDRVTLIRRATFDLTGLPPTPEEIDKFVNDDSANAFAKLVDRLLQSDRYGEQWGKHWLDVVRYADSSGFANDFARPSAWRYRDYVIRAFNNDKPYDQFIREQIAGDEMDSSNPENLIAVGLLRMGPWEHTGMAVAAVTRQQYLDDITNSIGVTFLGNELRCAKCHDHKFDPIPTRDYYRVQAVFASLQFADRDVEYLPVENTRGFEQGRRRINKLIAAGGVKGPEAVPPDERPTLELDKDSQQKGHAKVNRKRSSYLKRELQRFLPLAFSVYSGPSRIVTSNNLLHKMPSPKELRGTAAPTHILRGGALESAGEKVNPGVLSVVFGMQHNTDPAKAASVTDGTGGRRLALANWIAAADNPLTARVMVNRIWQYHFGRALAGNPNNFGQTGKKPTHPELLDYLATYFVEHGWSVKQMHRLIMLSDAYQRSAQHPDLAAVRELDPGNELLAVYTPRRLTAEELRDSMLMVSGELNFEMGGVPVRPEINMEVAMQPRHIMGSVAPAYQPNRTPAERNRRTIYAERIRTLRDPMLEVFNQPGPDASCERRDSSSTAPQVFSLFNSQHSYDRALAMARRIEQHETDPTDQVKAAFRWAFSRSATAEDTARCIDHLKTMTRHHQQHSPVKVDPPRYVMRQMVEEQTGLKFYWVEDLDMYHDYVPDLKPWDVGPETRALADLCLVLLNSNEFIYVY